MYKIRLRLKYQKNFKEFMIPGKKVGNITVTDYHYDNICIIIDGTTYYRKDIMVFSSSLITS